jgi:hypothetical protein
VESKVAHALANPITSKNFRSQKSFRGKILNLDGHLPADLLFSQLKAPAC